MWFSSEQLALQHIMAVDVTKTYNYNFPHKASNMVFIAAANFTTYNGCRC